MGKRFAAEKYRIKDTLKAFNGIFWYVNYAYS